MKGQEYLLLSGVGCQMTDESIEPLGASDFQVTVDAGPGRDVPIPEWADPATQAAVELSGKPGTVFMTVTSAKYPGADPLLYSVDVGVSAVRIVGNWTRVAAPA